LSALVMKRLVYTLDWGRLEVRCYGDR